MKNYSFKINLAIKKNYKGVVVFDNNFLKQYLIFRQNKINKITKLKKIEINIPKSDFTYHELAQNYFKKKFIKKIKIYYKKFEVNLSLRKKYNQKNLKLSNEETFIETYVLLGLLIIDLKSINLYQKINCILKICDKVLLKKKNQSYLNKKEILKLLNWEIKVIRKIANV